VFERRSELGDAPGGLAVQSNAMSALQRLGVAERVAGVGTALRTTEICNSAGKVLLQLPVGDVTDARGAPTVAVSRGGLQLAMSGALEEGVLRLGAHCTEVEQDDEGVIAHFAGGRTERGTLLIGADGGRSVVRGHVYGASDAQRRYSGVTAWRSVVEMEGDILPPATIRFYYGRGRQFTLAALGRNRAFWGMVNTEPAGGKDPPEGIRRLLCNHLCDFPEVTRQVVEATPEAAVIRTDIYDRDPERTWVRGRVALLGDAAHQTTPFIGQGAGISMEDSVVLAKQLALSDGLRDQRMIANALASYERVRIPRCAKVVLDSRRRGQMYRWTNPVLIFVRNTVLSNLPRKATYAMLKQSVDYEP
jgi:2-polyprenyl-6-methoxyphenol hydroxylase-like FAD-dependent oxidoreductase